MERAKRLTKRKEEEEFRTKITSSFRHLSAINQNSRRITGRIYLSREIRADEDGRNHHHHQMSFLSGSSKMKFFYCIMAHTEAQERKSDDEIKT
jgi:hypothetical protein